MPWIMQPSSAGDLSAALFKMMIALFIQDRIPNCHASSQFPVASLCKECCIPCRMIIWELAHCTTIARLFIVSFLAVILSFVELLLNFYQTSTLACAHDTYSCTLGCLAIWTHCIFIMFSLWQSPLNQDNSEIRYTRRFVLPGYVCVYVHMCKDICTHIEWKALGTLKLCLRVPLLELYHIPQPCIPPSAMQDNNVVETLCLWGEGFKSIILRLGILPGGRDRSEVLLEVFFF